MPVNAVNSLPPGLQSKFNQLEWRIRVSRLVRGFAAWLLVLTAWFVVGYLADVLVGWSVAWLRGLNATLLGAAVAGLGAMLWNARRPMARQRLAALVERRYPALGERLASTVELQESAAPLHGAPELIHGLSEETADRAVSLDFRDAYSVRATRKLAWAAAVLAVVAFAPVLGSDTYARFGRRLLLAWSPSVYGYSLSVAPGDQFIGRGRSAAVQVRLTAIEDGMRLPNICVLIYQEGDSAPRRQRMESVEAGTFSFTWPVVSDVVAYHVEAGDLASATFRIEPVDPVAITPGGLTVKVTPPPYVNPDVMSVAEHAGHAPFTALQYSRVGFQFAFDRPAHKATIRWRTADNHYEIALGIAEKLADASWEFLAFDVGPSAATLVLEAEHGIVSTYPLPTWSVWTDDAPWFSAAPDIFSSGGLSKSVAPEDVVPIKAVAEDQVGLGRVEVEYSINDGPAFYSALADGKGHRRVGVDSQWRLQGLVKLGDDVKFRLRVADNRRLTRDDLPPLDQVLLPHDLLPNVTYLPQRDGAQDRWWSFKIERQAEALAKQLASAQRDEFREWIERIKKQLEQERQQVQKVKSASHQVPVLSQEQADGLAKAQQQNLQNQQELRALSQKAGQIDSLQRLARLSFDVARRELGDSDQALSAAQAKSVGIDARERELEKADQALASALKRLGELQELNEALARERLDIHELEKLAAQERELARKAEELAAQPKPDEKELDRLRDEQAKIAKRLEQLAEKNPHLQQALQQLRQAQAQKLAKDAQKLAMNQQKLSEAAEARLQAELQAKFGDLARQQRELAGKVEKLESDLQSPPAPGRFETPHRPAQKAADNLRDGKVEPALVQQQTVEDALQALADELDRALAQDGGSRNAVQKLARTQQELLSQLEKLGEDFARLPIEQTRQRLADITRAQKALHEAVGKLDVPKSAVATQKAVEEMTGEAAELLQRKDALQAFLKMEQARDALQAWARSLPEAPPPLPTGKNSPETLAARKQAGRARQLAKDQHSLRESTRKLLGELAKGSGVSADDAAQRKDVEKLAQQVMELSQSTGPEAKRVAQQAADAVKAAQKAMAKSKSDKEAGRFGQAKQNEAESAMQLSMAGKKLDEAAQAMKGPSNAKEDSDSAALQKSFQDSQMKLEQARRQLEQQPKNAAASMQQAAQALQQTAKQAQQQMSSQSKPAGGSSPAQSFQPGGASSAADILSEQLKAHAGKSWGELPGELRTRIVQDLRARYGDEYGPIIQRYFQQIADVPGKKLN